jgi:putative two-component system response regulator
LTQVEADEQELRTRSILVVDDQELNLKLLSEILELAGYTRVAVQTDPTQVAAMLAARPDLVLLDLHMPGVDGFQLLESISRSGDADGGAPVIVLTADVTETTKRRALTLGARDFLTKPVDRVELLLRVRNVLQVQQLQERLRAQNATLEVEVRQRTRELEVERLEMLDRLALAAEFRDDDTQEHARRIGRMSGLLARALSLDEQQVELIARASPLHDIGKIGIPDTILLKPGRLTAAEFDQLKQHTTIGGRILSGGRYPVLQLGRRIALTHHERWDGSGYPGGLSGQVIPLEGRIVAVADVFDALTHERPYKDAWSLDEAVAEMVSQAGRQFDPRVIEAFLTLEHTSLLRGLARTRSPWI